VDGWGTYCRRNIAKHLNRLNIGRTSLTDDRQTDRQTTDGLAIAYSERERELTFAKNREWAAVDNPSLYGK